MPAWLALLGLLLAAPAAGQSWPQEGGIRQDALRGGTIGPRGGRPVGEERRGALLGIFDGVDVSRLGQGGPVTPPPATPGEVRRFWNDRRAREAEWDRRLSR